jgi:hypothetical protein
MFQRMIPRGLCRLTPLVLLVLGLVPCTSCSGLKVSRDTQTSGTFESKGTNVNLIWYEIPKSALDIARENAADSRLTNIRVTEAKVYPYWGPWFDWVLQIVGLRFAKIKGTWGFTGEGGESANGRSN